uniref:hypothetical protein n=1 Tax=Yoonia sp. TaxID=2212373 RepID=UPI004047AAD1
MSEIQVNKILSNFTDEKDANQRAAQDQKSNIEQMTKQPDELNRLLNQAANGQTIFDDIHDNNVNRLISKLRLPI